MLIKREETPTLATTRFNTPLTLSRWLDQVFDDAFNWTEGVFIPELNVVETPQMFEITVELPGMNKNDFEINYSNNVLTISGERRDLSSGEENGRRYHRMESRFGRFSRSLPLPNIVDADKIKASYENGILTIAVPKLKEKAGRRIEIS
jgi:HSP20 family protein